MKVFIAGILTETNTFAPTPTGMQAFEEGGILRGHSLDADANLDADAPLATALACLRRLCQTEGHELAAGLIAAAEPSGTTLRAVYESLRDELLQTLRAALPVQAVILPLHGAMVAEGYFDCEGDLIESVRAIVGPSVPIGVELDLHCHFTERMRREANVIVAFKEYPHTDPVERLQELWRLTLDTALGRIAPVTAVYDCRMVSFWHTTREPMKSFVQRMKDLEGHDGVLSVSFGHGFPYGDTPDTTAKVWVVADSRVDTDGQRAAALAAQLGREIWDMREAMRPDRLELDAALDQLLATPPGKPVVLADRADNSGGGAASDSTFVLRRLIERSIDNVALGAFWDPGTVQACEHAGAGAVLDLRVGGKCGPCSGDPVDLRVTVRALKNEHTQTGMGVMQACGASAWVSTDGGIDLVLVSLRCQVFGTDLFTGLGIDLASKRAVVVKSSQHFHDDFAPIAQRVLYVDTPGLLRNDLENMPYRQRDLNFWPRISNPWEAGA